MAMSDTTRPGDDGDRDHPFDDGETPASQPGDDAFLAEERARENAADLDRDGELDLDDDDTRLPWLESADDDAEESAHNTGQLVAFVLLGLLLLGLIVGGIWWATHRGADDELVADGSVIEAPEGDYKERPEDPGGKTFEGTGDSSYAVSEGETRPAKLGEGEGDAKPGFETVADSSGEDGGASGEGAESGDTGAAAASTGGSATGPGVQVGAYSSRKRAEQGWNRLSQQYSALKGSRYRIVEGKADIGTVFRLQALPGDKAAATALCSKLKSAGLDCAVKD